MWKWIYKNAVKSAFWDVFISTLSKEIHHGGVTFVLGSAQTRKPGACFEDLGDRALSRASFWTVESLLRHCSLPDVTTSPHSSRLHFRRLLQADLCHFSGPLFTSVQDFRHPWQQCCYIRRRFFCACHHGSLSLKFTTQPGWPKSTLLRRRCRSRITLCTDIPSAHTRALSIAVFMACTLSVALFFSFQLCHRKPQEPHQRY